MNPEAPEFQPPGARNRAWSNPAKSVSIAKLPPRRRVNLENQDQISSSGLVHKDFRVLPRPEEVRHSSKSPEDEEKDSSGSARQWERSKSSSWGTRELGSRLSSLNSDPFCVKKK